MPTIELPKGMPPGMTSARRAIHGMPPGMLALSTGPGGSAEGDESDGYRNPSYPDHEDIGEGPWNNHTDMMRFHDHELHPDLAEASIRDVDSHGRWHILVPSALRQQISESGQRDVLTPTHAVRGPAEPDYHDPAHPKVTVWHNDIAYTVPVHPRALSPEHMQALADYEVHRRQHEKLEQQLRGERDAFGDRRPDLTAEESDRLGRSQRQLNHLHSIMRGAGTAAVGTISPYQKFVRRKLYQAVRQGDLSTREYRGQVLPDREAAIESMYPERRSNRQGQLPSDMKVEEFPGIWSIVNHQGKVTHNGVSSHPYSANFGSPYWREQVLADARNKNLVANRLHHLFGDPPDIDMSKLPISTYGKARMKTAEWFSNLPPEMSRGEPLPEYRGGRPIGSQPVESQPALGLDDELTDWTQTPKRLERLQKMQRQADAGDTDKDNLNHDDYFEPTDEELQEKREDEKNAISGHRPPDYQGLASRLEKEVPFFRGRVRPIGSNGIMVHDPRGSGRLQIGDRPGYYPETRTLVVRHDAEPMSIFRDWAQAMARKHVDLPRYRDLEESPTMEDITRMGLSNRRRSLPSGMLAGT